MEIALRNPLETMKKIVEEAVIRTCDETYDKFTCWSDSLEDRPALIVQPKDKDRLVEFMVDNIMEALKETFSFKD